MICATVTFADDIEEIKEARDIGGKDNLYVIATPGDGDLEYRGRVLKGADGTGEGNLGSNSLMYATGSAHRRAAHESFHGLGIDHDDMPTDNNTGDYKTFKNMGTGYDDREKVGEMRNRLIRFERIKRTDGKK